jgi:peptidyl-prolyl cis-trans isomerase D
MKFLRSQSQTVLVVVLGVIAVGFLFYGSAGNMLTSGAGGRASTDYGRIDGEDVSVAELYDAVRTARNSVLMSGQEAALRQPGASKQLAQLAWRQLLIRREADLLHIYIGDSEVADAIRKQSSFQKDGAFNLAAYNEWVKGLEPVLHGAPDSGGDTLAGTKAIVENVIRDELRSQAVSEALFDSVRSSPHDVSAQYEKIFGPTTVSYVVFDPKNFAAQIKITPQQVEDEYKSNPTDPAYRTKEKRKVDFVLFSLTPEQQKLPDDHKKAAKDALGQKALDFALAFQPDPSAAPGAPATPPDFQAEAKKRGLDPMTTDFFADDSSPANVPPSPAFNSAAFALTKDDTISKVVEMANGVAVLHLAEIQPSALRPLDEVKADIQKHLEETNAEQAARVTAGISAKVLQAAVAKGTDFKTAAAGMKLKVETLPAFVPGKLQGGDPKTQSLAYASISLKAGDVSEPIPMQGEGTVAVVHVDSRAQPAPAGLADFEKSFRDREDQQLRGFVSEDWTNWKSKQDGTHRPPELEAFGSVE